jgi:Fe-S-cluster containining protein
MSMPNQPDLKSEFEHILFQTIQEKLHRKKSEGLTFHDAILPVFQEALEFSDSIVQNLEENGQSPKVACQSGCNYCCHSQVNIIPIEALLISAFIKTDFTCTEVGTLNADISHIQLLTAGKTVEQVYALKGELPCLFLKKGKCSIYKMRPSICRSWNSFDSKTCKDAYNSIDYRSTVISSPARNFVFGTTRAIFKQLSEAFSLQSEILLLHNAMSDCVNSKDPIGQWVRGCALFKYEY